MLGVWRKTCTICCVVPVIAWRVEWAWPWASVFTRPWRRADSSVASWRRQACFRGGCRILFYYLTPRRLLLYFVFLYLTDLGRLICTARWQYPVIIFRMVYRPLVTHDWWNWHCSQLEFCLWWRGYWLNHWVRWSSPGYGMSSVIIICSNRLFISDSRRWWTEVLH